MFVSPGIGCPASRALFDAVARLPHGPRPTPPRAPPPAAPLLSEAREALALWRGVEAASGCGGLLELCGTLDVAPGGGDAPAAVALLQMGEACQASGIKCATLAAGDVLLQVGDAVALYATQPTMQCGVSFRW